MKNIMRGAFALSWLATVNPAWAQNGIDEQINSAIKPAADAVAGFIFSSFPVGGVDIPFVLVWLIVAAWA